VDRIYLKGFGVVRNMFKKNIKIKQVKKARKTN